MKRTHLTGTDIYHAFLSGARTLINNKNFLNKINVFPVADGDTGSNMASLMQRIIVDSQPFEHVGKAMESISSAALAGSRGNSGIIFSEYLNGVYEGIKDYETVNVSLFHQAVLLGIKKAYEAIQKPVEGTILTVFRKSFLFDNNTDDFHDYFASAKVNSELALKDTPKDLEVLKINKVVDAGASGLTLFIQGINYYFETGVEQSSLAEEEVNVPLHEGHHEHEALTERFCTEALLTDVSVGPSELKVLMKDMGSSLVVSGRREKMRIHIHSNEPDQVMLKLRNFATIIEQKVDDMLRQQQATSKIHPRIAVISDTIADIPSELADKYHIHFLPLYLIIDDVSYLDKFSITTNSFYKMMDTGKKFSTSQADRNIIERNLSFLMQNYDHVLVITVASKLSGTYNAIAQYAKKYPQIHVFDSRQNSGAQGLVVLKAAKLAYEGKDIDYIVSLLEDFTKRTKIYVSVKTLKYMIRQGRINKVTGLIGKIINLKPVVSLGEDGSGIIADKAFSLSGNVRKIMKLVKKASVENYIIVHALDPVRAAKLASKVEAITGKKPEYIETISPIVAMNAGIGAVAVALTYEKESK